MRSPPTTGTPKKRSTTNGNAITAHTTNPVPLILVGEGLHGHLASGGKLGDVAPTLLSLMGLPIPERMTGKNLYTSENS